VMVPVTVVLEVDQAGVPAVLPVHDMMRLTLARGLVEATRLVVMHPDSRTRGRVAQPRRGDTFACSQASGAPA